jgi:hypothetical protein
MRPARSALIQARGPDVFCVMFVASASGNTQE